MFKERQVAAARVLEDLVPQIKETILQLRAGQSDQLAYALLYDLRWQLGKAVNSLGEGLPHAFFRRQAQDILGTSIAEPDLYAAAQAADSIPNDEEL